MLTPIVEYPAICKPWLTADIIRLSQFKWPLRGTFRLQGASSYEYSFFIDKLEQKYQQELTEWLKILGGLIPNYYSELCDRIERLSSYLALETARNSTSPDHLLPAVGQTVEVMGHIAWQYDYTKSLSSQWKVNYLRVDGNALEISYSPKKMSLAEYIENNIRESLEKDYQADLSRMLFNPVLYSIIEETEKICYQAKTCFVTLEQIMKE